MLEALLLLLLLAILAAIVAHESPDRAPKVIDPDDDMLLVLRSIHPSKSSLELLKMNGDIREVKQDMKSLWNRAMNDELISMFHLSLATASAEQAYASWGTAEGRYALANVKINLRGLTPSSVLKQING